MKRNSRIRWNNTNALRILFRIRLVGRLHELIPKIAQNNYDHRRDECPEPAIDSPRINPVGHFLQIFGVEIKQRQPGEGDEHSRDHAREPIECVVQSGDEGIHHQKGCGHDGELEARLGLPQTGFCLQFVVPPGHDRVGFPAFLFDFAEKFPGSQVTGKQIVQFLPLDLVARLREPIDVSESQQVFFNSNQFRLKILLCQFLVTFGAKSLNGVRKLLFEAQKRGVVKVGNQAQHVVVMVELSPRATSSVRKKSSFE